MQVQDVEREVTGRLIVIESVGAAREVVEFVDLIGPRRAVRAFRSSWAMWSVMKWRVGAVRASTFRKCTDELFCETWLGRELKVVSGRI